MKKKKSKKNVNNNKNNNKNINNTKEVKNENQNNNEKNELNANKNNNVKVDENKNKEKKSEKKDIIKVEEKEKKSHKFIEIIKKKWLINGTKTAILVLAIIAVFMAINLGMQKWNPTPLDFTEEKLYTLTDESKDRVKNIDKNVNIYFVGYTDSDSNLDLAKQYNKVNDKITAEAVDSNSRPDLTQKYGIESGTQVIIVECGDKSKVLTSQDLVTYDTSSYETISVAEQKLTGAIISVTSDKTPKVYFLEGYSMYSLDKNMQYLKQLLSNEINEINTLNVLTTGKIPDDCDTLVITTPNKDFDDVATKAITDYINSGRNILWLNSAQTTQLDLPNVNKILDLYGVKPFEIGAILENDSSKKIADSQDVYAVDVQSSDSTKNIANTTGPIFINATKINFEDSEKLEELKVEKTELASTSESSTFVTNFTSQQVQANSGEKESYTVGAELDKTIKEANADTNEQAVKSKMIIYGENLFVTDIPLSQESQYPIVQLGYNKELVSDAISYLTDREEDIEARKDTGTVTYTATDMQDKIVKCIIFIVPIAIVIAGIVVWQVRRRKK